GPAVGGGRRAGPGATALAGSPQHAGGRFPAPDRPPAGGVMAATVTRAPAAAPGGGAPSGWSLAVRQLRFWLTNYRRTWRGSIYSSVLNPVLFLGAMGLGLGSLVNQHGTSRLGGVSYLAFLAPGLLAAAGMETAVGESTYPVYGSVKWNKTYQAAVASPLSPADIFHGHVLFAPLR